MFAEGGYAGQGKIKAAARGSGHRTRWRFGATQMPKARARELLAWSGALECSVASSVVGVKAA
jgi:hypothetical protein